MFIVICSVTSNIFVTKLSPIISSLPHYCPFHRVDEFGFFIFWKSEGREGDAKELSQVNDIRVGESPKVSYSYSYRYSYRKGP